MVSNKVVVQYKDGNIAKGSTGDFLPTKPRFHLNALDGSIQEIEVEKIKALFFVKDVEGNKDYQETYEDVIQGGGRKVEVEFNDGETIVGYVQSYSPDRQGFIMSPADLNGNNERIFVVMSSAKSVKFV
jgi:hypothetical protein